MRKRSVVRRALRPAFLSVALLLMSASPAVAFERLEQYGVGIAGSGNGQFAAPYGLAVAPDGTVVVSDIGNQRVSIFDQSGRFLRAFGKDVSAAGGVGAEVCSSDCKAGVSGTGSGELSTPWGIAAGADEIYVAEQGNQRVSVFNYQGQFLRAFGADVGGPGVNLCTSSCKEGTPNIGGGQMIAPTGLALSADGKLYVGELGLARVDVFDPRTGQFERAFGKNVGGAEVNTCTTACQAGVSDNSPGSINAPYSLAMAANGDLFISEVGASRISVFASNGQYQRVVGGEGEAAGQLQSPFGVAVDSTGNAFVADTGNSRLSVFGPAGEFLRAYGRDVIPGAPEETAEVCTAVCKAGAGGLGIGEFASPFSIATDCRGAVYVATFGRIDKWGDAGARVPPCPSNAFSFGKTKRNKKKGTLTVEVTVPGPGSLVGEVGKKLKATVPQPAAAGTLVVTLKAIGKGIKTLSKKGKLKGTLRLTFTPPNGDPNTQATKVQLVKKLKKHKKKAKGKDGKPAH